MIALRFLGTGAAGGTPGAGRSLRLESSLLVQGEGSILLDLTRRFGVQAADVQAIDAVLLTHAHRDACGGVPQLRAWLRLHGRASVRVLASAATIAVLRRRYAQLEHCELVPVSAGERHQVGGFTISALTVPHARDPRYPTFAWRLRRGPLALVYASDLARLTGGLRRFARGADALVIDAALWRGRLFSHLRIDEALPELCRWPVGRILLTHIGRTAPAHEQLEREAAQLCARAGPAYDGMRVELVDERPP